MSQTLPNRTHYLISHADEILTNSNYTKNLVREVEGNTFTKVTGCGISKEKYEEVLRENSRYDRADKLRKRLNIAYCKYFWGKDTILLSYVGRLSHEKNVERIIDICNEDSQFVAIIAGVGPKEEALKKRVNDLGLSDRVVFAGRVTEGEKWDIWQASDFGMLMSEPNEETGNVEGFGIVLLECAVCGAIPICSGVGGMVDCVEDGQTGRIFAPTLSASEVAFQLKRLFDDQPEMQRLVSNAQKQVSEKFNWEAIAKEILKYPPAVRGAKIMLEKTFLHHYLTKMSNVLRKKRK
ncbi:glycosyltransferase family 4 protein [Pseudovibrio denitrificans]|nr:glycosyltransferase [Pseudovibrio denitrificans]